MEKREELDCITGDRNLPPPRKKTEAKTFWPGAIRYNLTKEQSLEWNYQDRLDLEIGGSIVGVYCSDSYAKG